MSTKRPVNPVHIDKDGNIEKPAPVEEAPKSHYPKAAEVYEGFYFRFDPQTAEGSNLLSGANCLIGTTLYPVFGVTADGMPTVQLHARLDQVIVDLDELSAKRLAQLEERGWTVHIHLSAVFYEDSRQHYTGEAAVMAYDPSSGLDNESFETFIGHIVSRIQDGDHPGLTLNQENFEKVIGSKGAWYLTKAVPLPRTKPGEAVFKRRMQPHEHLTEAAAEGNRGCYAGGIIFWIVVALVVIWAIWHFFLS